KNPPPKERRESLRVFVASATSASTRSRPASSRNPKQRPLLSKLRKLRRKKRQNRNNPRFSRNQPNADAAPKVLRRSGSFLIDVTPWESGSSGVPTDPAPGVSWTCCLR